ncbi:MAG TPA: hypothetical protein VL172_17445 [Kofleriaceae bacterium]|nr:hypothetical protein [Kofleriaceae bacterium]
MIDFTQRTLRILHGALMFSQVVYVVIAYVVTRQPQDHPPDRFAWTIGHDPLSSPLVLAFGAVALLTTAALPTLRPRLLPARQPAAGLEDPIGPLDSPAAARALSRLRSGQILTWALCESIAIWGLVLAMLSWELWPVLPFVGLGLVNMLAYQPRRAMIEEVVRAANRAAEPI